MLTTSRTDLAQLVNGVDDQLRGSLQEADVRVEGLYVEIPFSAPWLDVGFLIGKGLLFNADRRIDIMPSSSVRPSATLRYSIETAENILSSASGVYPPSRYGKLKPLLLFLPPYFLPFLPLSLFPLLPSPPLLPFSLPSSPSPPSTPFLYRPSLRSWAP